MDFKDEIKQLSERVTNLKDDTQGEEATKTAFILPFIKALGYDIFNPNEVKPEFICDTGTKKGEKVDYAIKKNNDPIILIECKDWKEDIDSKDNHSQLFRYFHVSNAKFGILTNGIRYKFYTDLVEPNIMDDVPFLEVDLTNVKDNQIEELKKFHQSYFDIGIILDTATDLKYTSEIMKLIREELGDPSEEFVRLFVKKIDTGSSRISKDKIDEYYSPLVKKSFSTVINDIITDKLQSVLNNEKSEAKTDIQEEVELSTTDNENEIVITEEDLEAVYTIKAILMDDIDPEKIVYNKTKNYLSISVKTDDNKEKKLCRLNSTKQGFNNILLWELDENKKEKDTKYPINSIYDIGKYKQKLKDRLKQLK